VTEPLVRERNVPSLIWLIPILTAILGGWLVVQTFSDRGPLVTITFRTADGIEVEKTRIKYKSLNIGVVEGDSFRPDFSKIAVLSRLN
jgi:paraquat-inducible protein B